MEAYFFPKVGCARSWARHVKKFAHHTKICRLVKMGSVEANVQRLLDGDAVDEEEELCDFTLQEQNEQQGEK